MVENIPQAQGASMTKSSFFNSSRLELIIAILIAVVSVTFALAAWRTSMVSSSAGDANRRGILDAVKKQAGTNENWRQTYELAAFAENYAAYLGEVKALEDSGEPVAAVQAANLRQYLLPNLQLLAEPLATDASYEKSDGTYDLQKYFDDQQADSPETAGLKPEDSFQLAARYYAEQRWLTVASVLLAISLFWLAVAEIGGKRMRLTLLIIGGAVYLAGLGALAVIEVVFIILRGGVL
jgi:hypothetical protein